MISNVKGVCVVKKRLGVLSIAVLLVCGFFLADHYLDLRGSWNQAQLLKDPSLEDTQQDGENESFHPYQSEIKRWQSANADVKGWLAIPDTRINLPMVQHGDNEFYLTRDATGANNQNGAAFIDYEVADLTQADHIIVYGHNMENGQVFSDLMKYRDTAYAEAHPRISLATEDTLHTYEVVLMVDMDLTDEASFFGFNSWLAWDEEKNAEKYMAEMRKRAIYDSGQKVFPEDRLLSLSTCENTKENARCILVAKEVS